MAYNAPENLDPESAVEHRANVPGIFGDTDTTGTAGPGVEVPTKDEEFAGEAVAQTDAEGGAEVAEARRQVDAASRGEFAEDVDAGAEDQDDAEDTSVEPVNEDAAADSDADDSDDDKTAAEVVDEINAASSVEEVDALAEGDDRKTVQKAADKKRDELNA